MMDELPMDFHISAAYKMRDLAKSSGVGLRMLAVNLDLPLDDAESIDFLRTALSLTSRQMREQMYRERANRIAASQEPQPNG